MTPTQTLKSASISSAPSSKTEPKPISRAVVLAAGRGSRLHSLTSDAPKCLTVIGGEPEVTNYPNLVVVKSMSKVFGVAGVRLGYLLSADQPFIEAVRASLPIWNINGLAEEFLRVVGRYRREFFSSCELTRETCLQFYRDLAALPGIEPLKPDANFILCKITKPGITGSGLARRMYVDHNILIKDCAAKSMPDADRYLRIASRTPLENKHLVNILGTLC